MISSISIVRDKKTGYVYIRLDPETEAQLIALAEDEDRAKANMARRLLEEALAIRKAAKHPAPAHPPPEPDPPPGIPEVAHTHVRGKHK